MSQAHRETFNDGYLVYGRKVTKRSSTRKRIGETFQAEGTLAFKLMSERAEDYQMAETMGHQLDLKVKAPLPPLFNKRKSSTLKIQIDGMEYDVITVDYEPSRRFLYFYLQEVGGVE